MPKKFPTRKVTHECMDALFERLRIWDMIHDGRLTSEVVSAKSVPARTYPNATSQIVKHIAPDGKHIATTHRIVSDDGGEVYHWDAKDIVINGIRLVRP